VCAGDAKRPRQLPETEREPRIEQTDLLISSFGTFFPPCTPSLAIHNYSAKLLKSNSTIKSWSCRSSTPTRKTDSFTASQAACTVPLSSYFLDTTLAENGVLAMARLRVYLDMC
jgi:hypothetical protein